MSLRLFRSELGMVFRRPRNLISLLVVLSVPPLVAIAVKVSTPSGGGEEPQFLNQIPQNGAFVAFSSLVMVIPFFLPLAVSVVAGDAIAGEHSMGTLRYLLTVPVTRTRLLTVKYGALAVFCYAATLLIAAVGVVVGLILFPRGEATLLSGTQVGLGEVLWRLLLVALFVGTCMAAVAAVGLFVSTMVGYPVAATAATVGICIGSQILGSIPSLDVIHPYLISHSWLAFGDLLRDPIATGEIYEGLLRAAAYVALFGSMAWARMSGKDVTS